MRLDFLVEAVHEGGKYLFLAGRFDQFQATLEFGDVGHSIVVLLLDGLEVTTVFEISAPDRIAFDPDILEFFPQLHGEERIG